MMVSRAASVFDESGKMTDEAIRKQLQQFLNGFMEFVGVELIQRPEAPS
jgi:hypothetical protein